VKAEDVKLTIRRAGYGTAWRVVGQWGADNAPDKLLHGMPIDASIGGKKEVADYARSHLVNWARHRGME
jgi:hypothetical protein